MLSSKAFTAILLATVYIVNAAIPACTSDYGVVNATLRDDTTSEIGITSNSAQQAGMYSINVGGYEGFAALIPEVLDRYVVSQHHVMSPRAPSLRVTWLTKVIA